MISETAAGLSSGTDSTARLYIRGDPFVVLIGVTPRARMLGTVVRWTICGYVGGCPCRGAYSEFCVVRDAKLVWKLQWVS